LDRTGSEIGRVRLEYWGETHQSSGMAGLWLFVDSPHGTYRFDGTGILVAMTGAKGEGLTYVFSGSYALAEQPDPSLDSATTDDVSLQGGTFVLQLGFWLDEKTLHAVDLTLTEG
jgi:hypothetical protein